LVTEGVEHQQKGLLQQQGGVYVIEEKYEMIISEIVNQVPDLYYAELIQVADFIRGIKAARVFLARHS
jgi:hypothetical protein